MASVKAEEHGPVERLRRGARKFEGGLQPSIRISLLISIAETVLKPVKLGRFPSFKQRIYWTRLLELEPYFGRSYRRTEC